MRALIIGIYMAGCVGALTGAIKNKEIGWYQRIAWTAIWPALVLGRLAHDTLKEGSPR